MVFHFSCGVTKKDQIPITLRACIFPCDPVAVYRKECLKVFCDAIEGLILVSDAPRCLALFYVANEVLQVNIWHESIYEIRIISKLFFQRGSDPGFWKTHLGPHLSSFLPRVCAVACQTQVLQICIIYNQSEILV